MWPLLAGLSTPPVAASIHDGLYSSLAPCAEAAAEEYSGGAFAHEDLGYTAVDAFGVTGSAGLDSGRPADSSRPRRRRRSARSAVADRLLQGAQKARYSWDVPIWRAMGRRTARPRRRGQGRAGVRREPLPSVATEAACQTCRTACWRFAENFTIAGQEGRQRLSRAMCTSIGTARVEVSQPRQPCSNITHRWRVPRIDRAGRGDGSPRLVCASAHRRRGRSCEPGRSARAAVTLVDHLRESTRAMQLRTCERTEAAALRRSPSPLRAWRKTLRTSLTPR